ncbi:MAG: hypothetical protein ACRD3M_03655 [Thermoanaerobaculia bacterium]
MKKFVTLGLVALLGAAIATGCKKKEEATMEATPAAEAPAVVEETGTATTTTETTATESTVTPSQ